MRLQSLEKSVGQACRLEVQVRVDVSILSSNSLRQANWLEIQTRLLCCSPEAEFLLQETSVFALKTFN